MQNARYLCVTDLETTGLNEHQHEIIQIGRVVVDTTVPGVVRGTEFSTYVRPRRWQQAQAEALEVNGITLQTLSGAPSIYRALGAFARGVNWEETVLAAWGNDFELKFLTEACKRESRVVPFNFRTVDVRSWAQLPRAGRGWTDYLGLREACDWYGVPFEVDKQHDALYDATKTAELAIQLIGGQRGG